MEPLTDDNLRDYLTALADGELDAAEASAVWTYLADRPDGPAALRWLAEQQRLTLAARVALRATAPLAAPAELRDRIQSLVAAEPSTTRVAAKSSSKSPGSWLRRAGYALALAAAVAIGVTITHYSQRDTTPAAVVPAELVVNVGRIHAECSRLPADLHDARFEETDARLAGMVRADLGGDTGAPDLKVLGFRLVGAGPCPASKFDTVHLLYRSARRGAFDAVSLFVQADNGQFPELHAGHVYRLHSATSPFPTVAWRSGKVIYFLLADNESTETGALQIIHPTPPWAIITAAEQ